jgi:hypothetical protein
MLFPTIFVLGQKDDTFEKLKSYTKGANVVIITTSDNIDQAFSKIGSLILDYGLIIENSDKSLYYLNTEYTSLNKYSFQTKINVRLKTQDNFTIIIIKGEALSGQFKFTPANNYKKGQVTSVCFAQMFELAETYSNGTITVENE